MMQENRAAWQNPRILTTLLLVFLAGSVAGALSMRLGLHRMMHGPERSWEAGGKKVTLERLKKELELTPEQTEKIDRALDDYAMYYQTLSEQLDEVRATGKSRILGFLNEQQKQKFGKLTGEPLPAK